MSMESPGAFNQASSYSAEVTRRAVFAWAARTSANNEGILAGGLLSASDLQLSAPASGLSVNVGVGAAVVGGSEGGSQGGYYARNASVTNLSLSAADPSLPRIDQVVLTIADSHYTEPTGGSGDAAILQVITGTPTAGASLSAPAGLGTVPGSSLLLGWVLVPQGATSIVTGDIANKASVVRLQSGGAYHNVEGNASADLTTSSSTFINPSSTLNLTWTPTLSVIDVGFSGHVQCDTTNSQVIAGLLIDGVEIARAQVTCPTTGAPFPFSWRRIVAVTQGSHTITVGLAVSGGGNGTLKNSGTLIPRYQVHEIVL